MFLPHYKSLGSNKLLEIDEFYPGEPNLETVGSVSGEGLRQKAANQ